MKYILFALLLSISLHLLILNVLKEKKLENKQSASTSKHTNKSKINYVKLKSIPQKKVQDVKKTEKKADQVVRKVVKKEIQKKKYKKVDKKKFVKVEKRKVLKKIPKKPIGKIDPMPNYTQFNPTKLQKNTLDEVLAKPVLDIKMLDRITQSYIKLYGEEYNSFTKIQKVYLQENLKNIGRITQQYLRYPAISVRTRQSGTNIIEFTLYPSGDISAPMITSSSGYTALDKNTTETIEVAYKDYPRPKEATKIRIYVTYRLY